MPALQILLLFALLAIGTFLILVVLVQRGRGGGLTGALGGMGGQSAFGTKAGDTFTKITIWTAVVWILLCVVAVKYLSTSTSDALGEKGRDSGPPSLRVPGDAEDEKSKTGAGKKDGQPAAAPGDKPRAEAPSSTAPAPAGPMAPPPSPEPPANNE